MMRFATQRRLIASRVLINLKSTHTLIEILIERNDTLRQAYFMLETFNRYESLYAEHKLCAHILTSATHKNAQVNEFFMKQPFSVLGFYALAARK
jgi:hypothetical protein